MFIRVASPRPGTRDDKTQSNHAPPLAQGTILRSRSFISQSKPDLPAHDSGSCGSVCFMMFLLLLFRQKSKTFGLIFLPFKLRLLREPICKSVCFEHCVLFGKRPVCIPRYHFVKISFYQSIVLPNIVLPKYPKPRFAKYQFATICLQNDQNDRSKSSQNKNLGRPQTPHFAQYLGVMVPLEPSSPVIATRTFRKYQS